MYTLRLKLNTTKYENYVLNKRFHAIWHVHNVMVKHAKKLLIRLEHDKSYQILLQEYCNLSHQDKLTKQDTKRKSELSKQLNDIRNSYRLTKSDFEKYLKVSGKKYRKLISSEQVQKESTRVWNGVEDILFDDGKRLRFKKYRDVNTIGGKSNKNGVKFCKSTLSIDYIGLQIPCKSLKDTEYLSDALQGDISYKFVAKTHRLAYGMKATFLT